MTKFKPSWIPVCLMLAAYGCTKDVGRRKVDVEEHRYPDNIASIILQKCATSGCHNGKSKDAAAGLNLETWDHLFEGGTGGAAVISYRPDFSTLMFYTNSYPEFGNVQLEPKMPFNSNPLSKEEVKTLFDWIKNGAPNSDGFVKFSDQPERKKFYAANQGCDVVAVFDAKSMLAMRYVNVGETRGIEAPHMVKVAPDNKHWYASFIAGGFFLKYSTADNTLVGTVNLDVGSWNTFAISSDSKTAYVIDLSFSGKIATVDLVTMTSTVVTGYSFPHGSALNKTDDKLYVTSQYGNFIYKFDVSDLSTPTLITLDGSTVPVTEPSLDPHEIIFSPDYSRYYVSCQGSNEIRVFSAFDDKLIAVIPTGEFPQEMAISKATPYLFVTCMEDTTSNSFQRSSVYIVNYNTNTVVKSLYAGYQSHGVAVDDVNKRVYISNRNILSSGPLPHHGSVCSGRNGYITAIDLNTLELIKEFKAEVSVDPYGLGITH